MGEEALAKAAALFAAALWAVTITIFTSTARRLGPQVVNGARLLLAASLLAAGHAVLFGTPWPTGLGGPRTFWLLGSGLVGFTLGDGFGLESFVRVGPRLGMLVQTLAPVFSTALAWAIFSQRLSLLRLLAGAVTLAGIAMVVGRGGEGNPAAARTRWAGLMFALLAALCQAVFNGVLTLDQLEAMLIDTAVDKARGNLSAAARLLGLTRPQLAYRLKRLHDTDANADTAQGGAALATQPALR